MDFHSASPCSEAVLVIRPGRPWPWPTQTRAWPTQTTRVIPMVPTYITPVGLPKICLAFDWPTQMKIPRNAPGLACQNCEFVVDALFHW